MQIDNVDKYMYETEKAIRKYVKNPDAFTEIYNRAYEAVACAMREVWEENHIQNDIYNGTDFVNEMSVVVKTSTDNNEIARLTQRVRELEEANRWIPVTTPPEHNYMVLLADLVTAEEFQAGIPSTTGFYLAGKWHTPTGCGVHPTHYKDCIRGTYENLPLPDVPVENPQEGE